MMRRYDVKYMPVKNGTILSTRDGFASVFTVNTLNFCIYSDHIMRHPFQILNVVSNTGSCLHP